MLTSKIYSKSEQVRRLLLKGIESGQFGEGDPLPSENVLSEKFTISRNTIREAISSMVNEGLLVRIQGKGTFIRAGARDILAAKDVRSFYLVGKEAAVSYSDAYFLSALLMGMHDVLDELNLPVRMLNLKATDTLSSYFKQTGGSFADLNCDGVVLGGYECLESDMLLLEEAGVKCVSVGEQAVCPRVPFVDEDHEFGAYTAVKHLTGLGHRRIAVLDSALFSSAFEHRQKGYLKAFAEEGISLDRHWSFSIPGRFSVEAVVDELLENVPDVTGLVIYPGIVSVFYRELERRGKSIPADISLVGCMASEHPVDIRVTEVRQSLRELSGTAVRMLLDEASGNPLRKQRIIVKPELVEGETTARAPQQS